MTASPTDASNTEMDKYVGSSSPLHTGTVVVLYEGSGAAIRLIDNVHNGPSISKNDDGSYTMVFTYRPENRNDLIGHNVSELQSVSAVGVRYAGLLGALDLDPSSAKVTHIALEVNGHDAASADPGVTVGTDEGSTFQQIPVASSFQSISPS
jgi:hypothetical protein